MPITGSLEKPIFASPKGSYGSRFFISCIPNNRRIGSGGNIHSAIVTKIAMIEIMVSMSIHGDFYRPDPERLTATSVRNKQTRFYTGPPRSAFGRVIGNGPILYYIVIVLFS